MTVKAEIQDTMIVVFRSRYHRPTKFTMSTRDQVHAWKDGMTFCTDKQCRCNCTKAEKG